MADQNHLHHKAKAVTQAATPETLTSVFNSPREKGDQYLPCPPEVPVLKAWPPGWNLKEAEPSGRLLGHGGCVLSKDN
jgi:hypothetical protein